MKTYPAEFKQNGFAMIELLIMVVVIGILSVMVAKYYSGSVDSVNLNNTTNNNTTNSSSSNGSSGSSDGKQTKVTINQAANGVVLQTDLTNASNQLKLYYAERSAYPAAIDCSASPVDDSICLRASAGNTFTYQSDLQSFLLSVTDGNGSKWQITDNSSPTFVNTP